MFSTFDSGISQINTFNVNNWQTPQISKSVDSENIIPIKIKTPKVKESFKDDFSTNIYQQLFVLFVVSLRSLFNQVLNSV